MDVKQHSAICFVSEAPRCFVRDPRALPNSWILTYVLYLRPLDVLDETLGHCPILGFLHVLYLLLLDILYEYLGHCLVLGF